MAIEFKAKIVKGEVVVEPDEEQVGPQLVKEGRTMIMFAFRDNRYTAAANDVDPPDDRLKLVLDLGSLDPHVSELISETISEMSQRPPPDLGSVDPHVSELISKAHPDERRGKLAAEQSTVSRAREEAPEVAES